MKKISWSDSLNIGVKKIDDQHKRLVQLTNNLISATQSGFADDILVPICQELAEYVEDHFRDEEMYMREVAFPKLDEHALQHRQLREKVQDYVRALNNGEPVDSRHVLAFLRSWLIDHLIHSDTQIGHHVRESRT